MSHRASISKRKGLPSSPVFGADFLRRLRSTTKRSRTTSAPQHHPLSNKVILYALSIVTDATWMQQQEAIFRDARHPPRCAAASLVPPPSTAACTTLL